MAMFDSKCWLGAFYVLIAIAFLVTIAVTIIYDYGDDQLELLEAGKIRSAEVMLRVNEPTVNVFNEYDTVEFIIGCLGMIFTFWQILYHKAIPLEHDQGCTRKFLDYTCMFFGGLSLILWGLDIGLSINTQCNGADGVQLLDGFGGRSLDVSSGLIPVAISGLQYSKRQLYKNQAEAKLKRVAQRCKRMTRETYASGGVLSSLDFAILASDSADLEQYYRRVHQDTSYSWLTICVCLTYLGASNKQMVGCYNISGSFIPFWMTTGVLVVVGIIFGVEVNLHYLNDRNNAWWDRWNEEDGEWYSYERFRAAFHPPVQPQHQLPQLKDPSSPTNTTIASDLTRAKSPATHSNGSQANSPAGSPALPSLAGNAVPSHSHGTQPQPTPISVSHGSDHTGPGSPISPAVSLGSLTPLSNGYQSPHPAASQTPSAPNNSHGIQRPMPHSAANTPGTHTSHSTAHSSATSQKTQSLSSATSLAGSNGTQSIPPVASPPHSKSQHSVGDRSAWSAASPPHKPARRGYTQSNPNPSPRPSHSVVQRRNSAPTPAAGSVTSSPSPSAIRSESQSPKSAGRSSRSVSGEKSRARRFSAPSIRMMSGGRSSKERRTQSEDVPRATPIPAIERGAPLPNQGDLRDNQGAAAKTTFTGPCGPDDASSVASDLAKTKASKETLLFLDPKPSNPGRAVKTVKTIVQGYETLENAVDRGKSFSPTKVVSEASEKAQPVAAPPTGLRRLAETQNLIPVVIVCIPLLFLIYIFCSRFLKADTHTRHDDDEEELGALEVPGYLV